MVSEREDGEGGPSVAWWIRGWVVGTNECGNGDDVEMRRGRRDGEEEGAVLVWMCWVLESGVWAKSGGWSVMHLLLCFRQWERSFFGQGTCAQQLWNLGSRRDLVSCARKTRCHFVDYRSSLYYVSHLCVCA